MPAPRFTFDKLVLIQIFFGTDTAKTFSVVGSLAEKVFRRRKNRKLKKLRRRFESLFVELKVKGIGGQHITPHITKKRDLFSPKNIATDISHDCLVLMGPNKDRKGRFHCLAGRPSNGLNQGDQKMIIR